MRNLTSRIFSDLLKTVFLLLLLTVIIPTPCMQAQKAAVNPPTETKLTEQTIYIPYEKLESVFEKEGRGIFLPYKEFLAIWTRQATLNSDKEKQKPPVDGVPVAVEYQGKVEGKVATIEARLEIRALKDGYCLVPLGVSNLSVSDARVEPVTPAAIKGATTPQTTSTVTSTDAFLLTVPDSLDEDQWKRILKQAALPSSATSSEISSQTIQIESKKIKPGSLAAILPGPGLYRFHLSLMLPVIEGPEGKYIQFQGLDAPVSRFTLDIPNDSVEFELTPTSAYTHHPGEGGGTHLTAFFSGNEPIRILWKPAQVEQERAALLFADLDEQITLTEGSTQSTSQLNLQVLLAGLDQIALTLPADAQVLSVSTASLKAWATEKSDTTLKVTIQFHTKVKEKLSLKLSYEVPVAATSEERMIPIMLVEGVQRQSGHIRIHAPAYLEIRPRQIIGLTQETVASQGSNDPPDFAYRYLRTPYSLSFEIAKTEPKVWTEVQTLVQMGLDKWVNLTRIRFDVKKASVFRVDLACPPGFSDPEVLEGDAPVSDFRVLGEEGKKHIEIELKEGRSGSFNLLLRCEKPWQPPSPDQSINEVIPLFVPSGTERIDGFLGVGVHESLAANISSLGGCRTEDIRTMNGLPGSEKGLPVPLTLGFRYRGETTPPTISINRRKPRVSAETQMLIEVREAFYQLTTYLSYQVEYAGVDEFVFSVPADIADQIHIEGSAIKEKSKEVKENLATWKVVLQDKQTGNYMLTVTYENPYTTLNEATATSRAEFDVPRVTPLNVFRANGLISVVKGGNLDITPTTQGLEAIDNKELPERLRPPGSFLAFRYDRGTSEEKTPWNLKISVERHAYIEIPTSVVPLADLHTVVNKEGHQVSLVTYYLQNKRAQFLELELPEDARILSEIFVGDKGEPPVMRETDKKVLIRLGNVDDPNTSIPVQFAYEQSIPKSELGIFGKVHITPPQLSGTRILQTNWTLFLPEGFDYTHFDGQMTEAHRFRRGWYLWRRYLDWAVPTPGVILPPVQVSTEPAPPSVSQQPGGISKVTIVEEGQRFELRRLDAPAMVTIRYRKATWSLVYELTTFLLAILLGVYLVRKGKTSRLVYCLTAGILAVLLSVLVAPRAAGPYQSFYLGVFCLALVWGVLSLRALWTYEIRKLLKRRSSLVLETPASSSTGTSPQVEAAAPVDQKPSNEGTGEEKDA